MSGDVGVSKRTRATFTASSSLARVLPLCSVMSVPPGFPLLGVEETFFPLSQREQVEQKWTVLSVWSWAVYPHSSPRLLQASFMGCIFTFWRTPSQLSYQCQRSPKGLAN